MGQVAAREGQDNLVLQGDVVLIGNVLYRGSQGFRTGRRVREARAAGGVAGTVLTGTRGATATVPGKRGAGEDGGRGHGHCSQ